MTGHPAAGRRPGAPSPAAPVIVLRDGEILPDRLRRERMSEDDLKAAARSQGHDDLKDIAMAVVEENGSISFIESS